MSPQITRRQFGRYVTAGMAAAMLLPSSGGRAAETEPRVETVEGSCSPTKLGITLPHEHILVDFIGAERVSRDRYDADQVTRRVTPYLQQLREAGGQTLVECTPAFLGRDPALLKSLAQATGLQIVTNTGYYGAAGGKYLPPHAHSESAEQLSARWIAEARDGIEQTGIRPGFIKIGVDGGPLSDVNRKIVEAAARTHQETGLTIAAHTGDGIAAREQLEILKAARVDPQAWIWVHAQIETDATIHRELAQAGAWVEFDGIGPDSIAQHVQLVDNMRRHSLLDRVLISHDAGWYWVGEPEGGTFRPYDTLFTKFLPALEQAGFTDEEIQQLTITNPAKAFAIS